MCIWKCELSPRQEVQDMCLVMGMAVGEPEEGDTEIILSIWMQKM